MAIVTRFNQAPKKTIALKGTGSPKAYLTTEAAGFHVGRQRMPGVTGAANGKPTHVPKVGAVVWLSDLQAQYELAQGHVTQMDPQPKSNSAEDVAAALAAQPAAAAPAESAPASPDTTV
jgi:hypothetical protein